MEPVIGSGYTFKIGLIDASAGGFKLTPTLAAGDFKISTASIGSGALTNLTNLPTESPAGSGIVVIILTAAEMADGDPVILWKDQTDPIEWMEGRTFIDTRPSLATISTELAKVPKSDGTATWNATALAAIQNEANDALVANHLDHLLAVTYDPASKPGVADALFNELVESDAGVSRFTANALEQAPTGGTAPTVAQIRTEMDTNSTKLASIDAKTTNLPTDPADASVIAGRFDAADIYLAAILAVSDKLDTALELDVGVYRFTTNALEQAPTGSGGGTPPTVDQIADEIVTRPLILHADYNAAKLAASQGSVNSVSSIVDNIATRLPAALTINGLIQADTIRIDGDDSSVWKESP